MGLRDKVGNAGRVEQTSTPTKPSSKSETKVVTTDCGLNCFPTIYSINEYKILADRIYDDFISRLNTRETLTEEKVREAMAQFIANYELPKPHLKEEIVDFVVDNLVYYGPITTITKHAGEELNDIIVNTKDYIDVIFQGKTHQTNFQYRSEEELRRVINKMLASCNRKVDEAHPIASGKLEDGSRLEVQVPPISANMDSDGNLGSYITIRKFRDVPLLFEQLIDGKQMNYKMAYFLIKAAQGKLNIIVSGGTSSGKTTFLNTLTRFVFEGDQLLTIEDTKEMRPQMPCHSIRSYEGRPANEEGVGAIGAEHLLRTALRSSPRRIIVGECRGGEIVVMLNAMNTGHPGSMTTVHADDTREAVVRIENMYLEARATANMNFVRQQIISAVDLIVQLIRFPDGSRKVVKISEPEKRIEEGGIVSIQDIFEFRRTSSEGDVTVLLGDHHSCGSPTRALQKMQENGVEIDKRIFNDEFDFNKDTLINELREFHPSIMCNWQDEYMIEIIKNSPVINGNSIIDRWPNLR
jgi:pilus assembly protein CpaF